MTIEANVSPISGYIGNDTAFQFSFDFRAIVATDVLVEVVAPTTFLRTTLVAGVDYTLSMKAFPQIGGSVSLMGTGQAWMTALNLKANYMLTISYSLSPAQISKFRDYGPQGPLEIEKALDRQLTFISSIKDSLSRCLRIPYEGASGVDLNLPAPGANNDRVLQVNDTGTGFIYGVTTAQIFEAEANAEAAATQSAASAEAAAVSAINAANSAAASDAARAASVIALGQTIAAGAAALVSISAAESTALGDIDSAKVAAVAVVTAATAAAELAASEAQDARDLAEVYRDQAAAHAQEALDAAASVTPKYQFLANQLVISNGTFSVSPIFPMQYIPVKGSGGPQTASTTPFNAPPDSGALLTIIGLDDAAVLTLLNTDIPGGMLLKGDIELGKDQSVNLIYNPTRNRYIESSRSV